MSSLAPYNDARTLLLAANLVPAANIHFANEPYLQPQTSLWLSVEAYGNVLAPADIGANVYIETGHILVYCIAPADSGTDDLRTLAKNVANVFRGLPARNPYYGRVSLGSGAMSESGDAYSLLVDITYVYQDITTSP